MPHTPTYRPVTPGDCKRGDHLVQMGAFGVADIMHHAMCLGDGTVAHYYGNSYANPDSMSKANSAVRIDPISALGGDGTDLFLEEHGPGVDREAAVAAVLSREGEMDYDLLQNNCEHLVNWALYGNPVSRHVETLWG